MKDAMLTDPLRKAVVQHIMNLLGIADNLSELYDALIDQIDDLAQALVGLFPAWLYE
uniref:Uncharacterized protein n=1 Tax=Candidatus Kentrum sp. MB TaxID=2138164 RepID=A0A450XMI8_9GAMM|nr:MAG: hypothetical protein BECKMB1821G_GA0114241_102127 [Candidatus Kentron sp. MB]VFK30368.1 MAG: hypothetical protein BECKMB1821I_GA0114274_101521 [Candidatus Kentron sp. MB]VFK75189.1 MAG: hypothetical protein BECKMB1821H_GA0114242_101721 [Candidatus Kentron sp. MB]